MNAYISVDRVDHVGYLEKLRAPNRFGLEQELRKVSAYMYIYIHVHICVYGHIYIYTYTMRGPLSTGTLPPATAEFWSDSS